MAAKAAVSSVPLQTPEVRMPLHTAPLERTSYQLVPLRSMSPTTVAAAATVPKVPVPVQLRFPAPLDVQPAGNPPPLSFSHPVGVHVHSTFVEETIACWPHCAP